MRRLTAITIIILEIHLNLAAVPQAPRKEPVKVVDCNGPIAFSTLKSVTKTSFSSSPSVARNKPVLFNKMLTDKFSGFSKDTGIFTTPCRGLYQLTFSGYGDDLRLALRQRPSSATNSWLTLIETGKKGGSQTLLLHLEQGEEVAVFIDSGVPYADAATQSFSGFKMNKI